MRIASTANLGAGLMFAAFGATALWLGRHYETGTAAAMGPGYFPKALGWILLALGAAIALRAFASDGPAAKPFASGRLLLLTGSVAAFALLIDRAGLCIAGVLLVLGSRVAAPQFRWREVLLLALGLTAACILVFGYGLGIPLRIWPTPFGD